MQVLFDDLAAAFERCRERSEAAVAKRTTAVQIHRGLEANAWQVSVRHSQGMANTAPPRHHD